MGQLKGATFRRKSVVFAIARLTSGGSVNYLKQLLPFLLQDAAQNFLRENRRQHLLASLVYFVHKVLLVLQCFSNFNWSFFKVFSLGKPNLNSSTVPDLALDRKLAKFSYFHERRKIRESLFTFYQSKAKISNHQSIWRI